MVNKGRNNEQDHIRIQFGYTGISFYLISIISERVPGHELSESIGTQPSITATRTSSAYDSPLFETLEQSTLVEEVLPGVEEQK